MSLRASSAEAAFYSTPPKFACSPQGAVAVPMDFPAPLDLAAAASAPAPATFNPNKDEGDVVEQHIQEIARKWSTGNRTTPAYSSGVLEWSWHAELRRELSQLASEAYHMALQHGLEAYTIFMQANSTGGGGPQQVAFQSPPPWLDSLESVKSASDLKKKADAAHLSSAHFTRTISE